LKAYRCGNHDVIFPYGTWMMREFFNVNIAPPAAAA
jgi:hypothetical protein